MLISKQELSSSLGVCNSTISNWIRTGLLPDYQKGQEGYSPRTIEDIMSQIQATNKLKSRVNRSHKHELQIVTGTLSYAESKLLVEWLLQLSERHQLSVDALMCCLSIKALDDAQLIEMDWANSQLSSNSDEFTLFLQTWLDEQHLPQDLEPLQRDLLGLTVPEKESDFMGVIYESMRSLSEKAKLGAFFTPAELVEDIVLPATASVLDPCSGTGTILLHVLDRAHAPSLIHLRDVDSLALRIAKVNFALFFQRIDELVHTEVMDVLEEQPQERFDYIITNPPWGAKLDKKRKKELRKTYPELKSPESFSIALFNALGKLKRGSQAGIRQDSRLIFILPESLLYVDAHKGIREILFERQYKIAIRFFGKAFKGVMSSVIRLELQRGKRQLQLEREGQSMEIPFELLAQNYFRPPALETKAELQILQKILDRPSFTLAQGDSTFGLGIVTGNNKAHLKNEPAPGLEPIYTGKELQPFAFDAPRKFIRFEPAKLQQVAPLQLYRQPKICYRFISKELKVVADFKGSLLLNSINFIVPDRRLSIKALCAFFNSPVASFLYQRLFNSIKVLRRQIEHFPIPQAFKEYSPALENLHDWQVEGHEGRWELHVLTAKMYGLDDLETEVLWKTMGGEDL